MYFDGLFLIWDGHCLRLAQGERCPANCRSTLLSSLRSLTHILQSHQHRMRQTLHHCHVAFIKTKRLLCEHRQQSHRFALRPDRRGQNRSDPKPPATLYIHSSIHFRVVTAQRPARPKALSRKSRIHIQPGPQRRSACPDTCPANYNSVMRQRNRRTRASSQSPRPLSNQTQSSLQIRTQRIEFVLHSSGKNSRQNPGLHGSASARFYLHHQLVFIHDIRFQAQTYRCRRRFGAPFAKRPRRRPRRPAQTQLGRNTARRIRIGLKPLIEPSPRVFRQLRESHPRSPQRIRPCNISRGFQMARGLG